MTKYVDIIPYLQETALTIHELHKEYGNDCAVAKVLEMALRRLNEYPSAEVLPVRHAHWEQLKTDGTESAYMCTWCNKTVGSEFDYCPKCGAKMDEEVEEEAVFDASEV